MPRVCKAPGKASSEEHYLFKLFESPTTSISVPFWQPSLTRLCGRRAVPTCGSHPGPGCQPGTGLDHSRQDNPQGQLPELVGPMHGVQGRRGHPEEKWEQVLCGLRQGSRFYSTRVVPLCGPALALGHMAGQSTCFREVCFWGFGATAQNRELHAQPEGSLCCTHVRLLIASF